MAPTTPTTTGTPLERFVGTLAITVFSGCYFYALLWLPCVAVFYVCGFKILAGVLAVPYLLSAMLPSKGCPGLLATWFFQCALKLHDFEEILETSKAEVLEIEKTKKIIFAVQPHGVISITGICAAIKLAPQPTPPTCAADVIGRIPILKHVLGVFGLVGASSSNLTRLLKKTSLVLYVGGIAELFLSSPHEERLYVGRRKGFIKLAMKTGSEVIPCYYFGNTTVLEIVRHPFLSFLSRKLGASITVLWGRWGLPLPMPVKMMNVTGKPLNIPQKDFPSDQDVEKYHKLYLEEVKRLFDTYKGRVPNYANKELIIETTG